MTRDQDEASSNGRTADFGSAHEGSNPSASANPGKPHSGRAGNLRAEVKAHPRPERLVLLALGEVARPLLHEVGSALEQVYRAPVVVGEPQQRPAYAFNKDRHQYHATAILRRLSVGRPPRALVLGLTDVDLFVPDAAFVFGEADRDAGSAVVSLVRLAHGPDGKAADADRLGRRTQVEAVHELGMLLGLSHCPDSRCAMFVTHRPSDSDRKGPGLCGSCRSALGLA